MFETQWQVPQTAQPRRDAAISMGLLPSCKRKVALGRAGRLPASSSLTDRQPSLRLTAFLCCRRLSRRCSAHPRFLHLKLRDRRQRLPSHLEHPDFHATVARTIPNCVSGWRRKRSPSDYHFSGDKRSTRTTLHDNTAGPSAFNDVRAGFRLRDPA